MLPWYLQDSYAKVTWEGLTMTEEVGRPVVTIP